MNDLTRVRENLAAAFKTAFGDDLPIYAIIPQGAVPPFGFLAPDSPYLAFGEEFNLAFGEAWVQLRLGLVVESGATDRQAEELDALVIRALCVDTDPFVITDVDEPGRLPVDVQEYLAAVVHLAAPIRLEA